jgi:DNA-directed RNA polymerase subunit RPC12/RpoP
MKTIGDIKMANTGRCMKCQKTVEIQGGKEVETKNHRIMLKGKCPLCLKRDPPKETTVCRIIGMAPKK